MIDCSTRWPEAVPLGCIDVDTVLEMFITMWVAHFGVPACITTDRGTRSTSGTWGDWCQKQGSSTSPSQPTTTRQMAWWSRSTAH